MVEKKKIVWNCWTKIAKKKCIYIYTVYPEKSISHFSVRTRRISQILSPLSISWLKTKESIQVPEVSEEMIFDVLNGFHLKPSRMLLKTTVCHFEVILGSSLLTQLWSQMKAALHVSKQSARFIRGAWRNCLMNRKNFNVRRWLWKGSAEVVEQNTDQ